MKELLLRLLLEFLHRKVGERLVKARGGGALSVVKFSHWEVGQGRAFTGLHTEDGETLSGDSRRMS